MNLNTRDRRRLKRIAARAVRQGPHHQDNIREYYNIMHDAARNEFREDNRPTLIDFLTETFTSTFTRKK